MSPLDVFLLRSDIFTQIWANDKDIENVRTHVIIREKGHYFGNCIVLDPPGVAPVGMDNKVCTNEKHEFFLYK